MSTESKRNGEGNEFLETWERFSAENEKDKETERINDESIIKELAEQANEAFKRGRSALLILFLTSVVLSVGFYNHRGSWLYTMDYADEIKRNKSEYKAPVDANIYSDKFDAVVDAINRMSENDKPEYKRHLLHDIWDGNFKTLDVPALGVEFYVADLPLVGSMGVFLVIGWYYVFRRRERGIISVIKKKVKDAEKKGNKHVIEYLYNSIALNQVFITAQGIDNPQGPRFHKTYKHFIYFVVSVSVLSMWGICSLIYAPKYIIILLLMIVLGLSLFLMGSGNKEAVIKSNNKAILGIKNIFSFIGYTFTDAFTKIGLFFPIIMLSVVLIHDVYETYYWESRGLKLPNQKLFSLVRKDSNFRKAYFSHQLNLEKEDSIFMEQYDLPMAYLNDLIIEPVIAKYEDTLVKLSARKLCVRDSINSHDCSYHRKKLALALYTKCQFEIEKRKDTFLKKRVTLGDFLNSNQLYYKRMNEENFRIFGFKFMSRIFSVANEVFFLRTLFPCFVIITCLVLVFLLHTIKRKIQRDFNKVQNIKIRFSKMDVLILKFFKNDQFGQTKNTALYVPEQYRNDAVQRAGSILGTETWLFGLLSREHCYVMDASPLLQLLEERINENGNVKYTHKILGMQYFLSKPGGYIKLICENSDEMQVYLNSFPGKDGPYKLSIYLAEKNSE